MRTDGQTDEQTSGHNLSYIPSLRKLYAETHCNNCCSMSYVLLATLEL